MNYADSINKSPNRQVILVFLGLLISAIGGYLTGSGNSIWVGFFIATPFALLAFLYPFVGLLIFIFLLPLEAGFLSVANAGVLSYTRILGVIVLGGWLIRLLIKKQLPIFNTPLRITLLLFVWAAASLTWAANVSDAIVRLLTFLQLVGLFFIMINEVNSRDRLWKVLGVIFLSCQVVSFLGVLKAISATGGALLTLNESQGAKNYSYFVGIGLFISMVFVALGPRKLMRVALGGLLLTLFPIFAIGERGTFVSLAVGSLAIFVANKYRNRTIISVVIIVIFFIAGFYILRYFDWLSDYIVNRFNIGNIIESAGSKRLYIWTVGLKMIQEHPIIGVGLENFKDMFSSYSFLVRREMIIGAHNDFLQMAAELGLVGLSIFIGFILSITRKIIPVVRKNLQTNDYLLGVLVWGLFVYSLSMGVTSVFIWRKTYWCILALTAITPHILNEDSSDEMLIPIIKKK